MEKKEYLIPRLDVFSFGQASVMTESLDNDVLDVSWDFTGNGGAQS